MKPRPVHSCECGAHVWLCLTQGFVALVSPEDRPKVEGKNWKARVNRKGRGDGSRGHVRVYALRTGEIMHRTIAGPIPEPEIDHINHNGVDNQRHNLRPATGTQNQYNCRKAEGKTSKFKGVTLYVRNGKWAAKIYIKGKAKHLGYFSTELAASRAYEEARLDVVEFAPPLSAR